MFAFIRTPFVEKVFSNKDVLINCERDYAFQEDTTGFQFINTANAGRLSTLDAIMENRYKLLEIEKNNQIRELCSGKKYYINLNFHADKFLALVESLLFVVIIFEALKQLGYYIFLGKMRHNWLTLMLVKIWM